MRTIFFNYSSPQFAIVKYQILHLLLSSIF
nr:MAG TPA: hypothetical protein [Caudoviricetes sp.]